LISSNNNAHYQSILGPPNTELYQNSFANQLPIKDANISKTFAPNDMLSKEL